MDPFPRREIHDKTKEYFSPAWFVLAAEEIGRDTRETVLNSFDLCLKLCFKVYIDYDMTKHAGCQGISEAHRYHKRGEGYTVCEDQLP